MSEPNTEPVPLKELICPLDKPIGDPKSESKINIKQHIKLKLTPRLKSNNPKNNPLIRHLAAIGIQSFYRRLIKWERTPEGQPIDPITREGISPNHVIRIIYQTMKPPISFGQPPRIKSCLQIFDLTVLWQAIIKSNKRRVAINPLTNTSFTRPQFQKILSQAIKLEIIRPTDVKKYQLRYAPGFRNDRYTSQYEVNDINLAKMAADQMQQQLLYYLLNNQTEQFLTLLRSQHSNQSVFNLNYYGPSSSRGTDLSFGQTRRGSHSPTSLRFPYLRRTSLLQTAVATGNFQASVALLELGAEVSLPYPDYIYPIQIALLERHLDLIRPLLLYGGRNQINWSSTLGTALEIAGNLIEQHPDIYEKLLT